ncbi:MAG: hypothetical protein WCP79_09760 [Bacillota bacterium]
MIDKKYGLLDEAATDSRYTDPDAKCPNYNLRAIDAYCAKKGIPSEQLTDEELRKFIVHVKKYAA